MNMRLQARAFRVAECDTGSFLRDSRVLEIAELSK